MHLARVILKDLSLKYEDLLLHVFFWSFERMIAFEDRIRTLCAKHKEYDDYWDDFQHYVFKEKLWTPRVHYKVVEACFNKKVVKVLPKANKFTGLAISRRNRRHHHDNDEPIVQAVMGPLPEDNFHYWERLFFANLRQSSLFMSRSNNSQSGVCRFETSKSLLGTRPQRSNDLRT